MNGILYAIHVVRYAPGASGMRPRDLGGLSGRT
jgi:hypothetical protein